jgi:hypothetical protein
VKRYPTSKDKSYRFLKNLCGKYMGYPAFFNGLKEKLMRIPGNKNPLEAK